MKKTVRLMVTLGLALAIAACAPISPGQQPSGSSTEASLTPVTVCTNIGIPNLPHAYAQKHGLFAKYGLEVAPVVVDSGTNATLALIAGDADICEVGGPSVVNAALAGEDLVFVAGINNRQQTYLIVRPEIQGPEDLKGEAMAVSSAGGSSDFALRAMLVSMGLTPDEDVTIVAVGGNPERLAAMESGQIAGTVLALVETARAETLGYRVLLEPSQAEYQATAVVARREFLGENRPTVVAYVRAITEAIARVKADREGARAVMADITGLDPVADAAVIDGVLDRFTGEFLPEKPYPTQAGVQTIIDAARLENPAAPELAAEDLIDGSIVEELDQSGFIDGLYAQ